MTDRELLELAAKAVDWGAVGWSESGDEFLAGQSYVQNPPGLVNRDGEVFNSLRKLDDAMLVALECDLMVYFGQGSTLVWIMEDGEEKMMFEESDEDYFFAACRAITRAAAEIQLHKERNNG